MESQRTIGRKLIAPFRLLVIEKIYWVWIAGFLIAFAGIIIEICNGNIATVFEQGSFFSTGLAIIAPLILDLVVMYSKTNRNRENDLFATYKSAISFFSILIVLILLVFYMSAVKTNPIAQLIMTAIVGLTSFYSYLVYKMDDHKTLLEPYKDLSYAEAENARIAELNQNAKAVNKATTADGKETQL